MCPFATLHTRPGMPPKGEEYPFQIKIFYNKDHAYLLSFCEKVGTEKRRKILAIATHHNMVQKGVDIKLLCISLKKRQGHQVDLSFW